MFFTYKKGCGQTSSNLPHPKYDKTEISGVVTCSLMQLSRELLTLWRMLYMFLDRMSCMLLRSLARNFCLDLRKVLFSLEDTNTTGGSVTPEREGGREGGREYRPVFVGF